MDTKTKLVSDVIMSVQSKLTIEQVNFLRDSLISKLNNYELQERCTEIAVSDNSSETVLRRFIATKRIEGKAESTLKRYYYLCSQALHAINKPVNDITTYDLRYYLAEYQCGRAVSNSTLDGMRRCLRSFFTWSFTEGLIDSNPSAALAQIKYEKVVRKPFSATDMERIKRSCKKIRDRAIVEFLYATGCRVSEMIQLNRNDVNFVTREIVVRGKGNKQRIVYINEICALYLQEYLQARTDNCEALFAGRGGVRLQKSGVELLLKRIGKVAGVNKVHPHRYRRTLATNLIDRGVGIQDVAAILGHEDINTTQIYCHISQNNVRNIYNAKI